MQQKLKERVAVSLSISNQAATYTADLNSVWEGQKLGWGMVCDNDTKMHYDQTSTLGHVCLKGIVPKVMGFAQMQI